MFATQELGTTDTHGGTQPVETLPADPPPMLHPVDTEAELLAVLARVDRLEAQAAALLAGVNERAYWRRRGYTSATAWLKHRAGYGQARATALVTRANALVEMPLAAAAYEQGEISSDQVDALCGAHSMNHDLYEADEADLVSIATQLPMVDELWRFMWGWMNRIDPEVLEDSEDWVRTKRGVRVRRENGMGRATIIFSEEELDVWLNSIDPGPPPPGDDRSLAQRRADRVIDQAVARTDRPQLVVTAHFDDLVAESPETTARPEAVAAVGSPEPGTADSPSPARHLAAYRTGREWSPATEYGTPLTHLALERLACDATVCRVVFGPASQILDVGRAQRLFTQPQRRAVSTRDGHCRFPGCDRPPQWCDVHHIEHWLRGGRTCVENGVLLCRSHHTLVHDGHWNLSGTPARIEVHDEYRRLFGTSEIGPTLARAP